MSNLNLSVGQKVQLNDGRTALVRFKGVTSFAPGEWVGVELEEPSGKNDGAVQGERYFTCEDKHGMFLRGTGIAKVLERATTAQRKSIAPTPKARPSSVGLARTTDSLASPTPARGPGSRLSGIKSPHASPTKPSSSANSVTSSRTSTPSLPRAPTTSTKQRTSLGPFSRRTPSTSSTSAATASSRPSLASGARSSLAPSDSRAATITHGAGSRLSVASRATESSQVSLEKRDGTDENTNSPNRSSRVSVASADGSDAGKPATPPLQESSNVSVAEDSDVDATPRAEQKVIPPQNGVKSQTAQTTASRSLVSSRPAANSAREIEDLKTKLRMLEKRRLEDREKLKALEKVQQERDRFESIIQKLQTKYQPQQTEISELKRQLKESEARFAQIEAIQADHDVELESATLDREMAEEQYETAQAELIALRERYEEAELELEVLREENQELGKEMSPEERTSQGWLQLERSNERYREALIRLRDITQEQEAELKQQITALEKDLEQFSGINEEADNLKAKLLESEAAISDLKQQLELAQGSEELLEELSDRNMTLQERIDDLNTTIEDLENLKELNDELEINHVEAEKQMQEEIDFKDSLLSEQLRRGQEQQKAIEDYEMTVVRFREAFKTLQADLEDMRASKEITDGEAEHLNSKSRALIDLNMKLQSSAAKTQIKTLDLELQRLEAEEAAQHLSIVRLFLPESYQTDRDSVLALLRIKRILFKSDLIQTSAKERLSDRRDDEAFAACTVVTRLAWISAMCQRLVNAIDDCLSDEFARFESALYELDPIERALNGYIDMIKRDEISWRRADAELERSMAVMTHLGTRLMPESPSATADEMTMAAGMMQTYLDATATALSMIRAFVEANAQPATNGHVTEGEEESVPAMNETDFSTFFESIDSLISQVRGVKVLAGKVHREVSELRTRHLALQSTAMRDFGSAQTAALQIATFASTVGETLASTFDASADVKYLAAHQVVRNVANVAVQVFLLSQPETQPFSTVQSQVLALSTSLSSLHNISTDLSQTHEFPSRPPPWVQRSQVQASQTLTSSTNEAEVQRLTSLLKDRSLELRTRERELDDQSVRIETLEARAKDAAARTARIAELETSLAAARKAEKDLSAQAKKHDADATRLRKERDDLRAAAELRKNDEVDPTAVGAAGRLEIERARHQVAGLRGAVRALAAAPRRDDAWLSAPLSGRRPRDTKPEEFRREVHALAMKFVDLAAGARMVDFRNEGDRLAWKPVRETGAWLAQRRKEELALWREERARVLRRQK